MATPEGPTPEGSQGTEPSHAHGIPLAISPSLRKAQGYPDLWREPGSGGRWDVWCVVWSRPGPPDSRFSCLWPGLGPGRVGGKHWPPGFYEGRSVSSLGPGVLDLGPAAGRHRGRGAAGIHTGRARGPIFLPAASLPLCGATPSVGEPGTGGSGRQACCPQPGEACVQARPTS